MSLPSQIDEPRGTETFPIVQRGGTAYGIGVSLATTIIFLLMIQLTKAIGGKALISPDVAAWLPNMLFAVVGLVLLMRVRT